jgi:hypothetical protein
MPAGAQGQHERLPVPTRQRRPALAALALVLVLGGAALSAFLVINSGQKQSVLVLSKDVEYGHVFTVSDFREGQVSLSLPGGDSGTPVLFSQLSQVVGSHYRATLPIRAGTILTHGMISTRFEIPGTDYASMGLTVSEGEFPPGLAPGDKVKVLYTPNSDKGVAAGGLKNGTPLQLGRTLVDVAYVSAVSSATAEQGAIVVTLVIKNEDLTPVTQAGLPIVAAANALKSISLVGLPGSTDVQTGSGQ